MDNKYKHTEQGGINFVGVPIFFILFLGIFYCLAANFFPIVQDEAYYHAWGHRLAMGYFDHPPLVAWLSSFSQLFGSSFLQGRLGTVLLGVMSLWIMFRLYRLCCFPDKEQFYTACLLGGGNAAALICGFLTTPDAVILFAWALALHESAIAMLGSPKRWLTAGLAVGIGLLGKYTMLLIGPVFLCSLLLGCKRQLATKWPYLGGVVALLVFSPNLIWNHHNGWVTWKFQLKHGLAQHRSQLVSGRLPSAQRPVSGGAELELASYFDPLKDPGHEQEVPLFSQKPPKLGAFDKVLAAVKNLSKGGSPLKRLLEFLSGQLALWGVLAFVIVGSGLYHIKTRIKRTQGSIPEALKPLLVSAVFLPLGVFGLFSLNGKVEANWAAMYLVGAAPLLAHYLRPNLKACIVAVCGNLFLLIGVIAYTNYPFIKVNPGFDRILMETHGFDDLARLPELEGVSLFADSFQLVSMLRYHNPSLQVGQWPGITRASEYINNEAFWSLESVRGIKKQKGFMLLTTDNLPPMIPGFKPIEMKQISNCREGYLKVKSSWVDLDERACGALHRWFLLEYINAE